MSRPLAERTVDEILRFALPTDEMIEIGFFGGEPLLEFDLLRDIVEMIKCHPLYDSRKIRLSVVTNGTVFSPAIGEFLQTQGIILCLSCDGESDTQDVHRRFANGSGSSALVEQTIRDALGYVPRLLVNAVFTPQTLPKLERTLEYFSTLGLRNIFLNPDFSSHWQQEHAYTLPLVYERIAIRYADWYLSGDPHYISLVDDKIALILKGGYAPRDRCRMGTGEFAFTPSGNIYPCERLVGDGRTEDHCIGRVEEGLRHVRQCTSRVGGRSVPPLPCQTCSIAGYCMTWCGCSNYMATGQYNQVGPLQCASERAALAVASDVMRRLERELGSAYLTGMIEAEALRNCPETVR